MNPGGTRHTGPGSTDSHDAGGGSNDAGGAGASEAPAGARRRSRRGDGESLRSEILEAASELLVTTGSEEAVSIRAVAERVGVTPPSIYLHFADKQALLEAVCVEVFTRFDAVMAAASEGRADPVEALRAIGRAYIGFALTHPEHYRFMFMRRPGALLLEPTEAEVRATYGLRHVLQVLEECQRQRLLDPAEDLVLLGYALWTSVHGVAALLIAKPHFNWPSEEALVERALDIAVRGVFGGTK